MVCSHETAAAGEEPCRVGADVDSGRLCEGCVFGGVAADDSVTCSVHEYTRCSSEFMVQQYDLVCMGSCGGSFILFFFLFWLTFL